MRFVFGHTVFKAVAMLAALAQIAIAAAAPAGGDPTRLICAPSGSLSSPETDAALFEFLRFYGEEAPEERVFGEHCPLCAPACANTPPAPPALTTPAFAAAGASRPPASGARPTPPLRGSPLGGRAPPVFL